MSFWDPTSWFRATPQGVTVDQKSTPLNRLDELEIGSREALSGVVVSELTALQVSTVQACVNRIALDIATMPLMIRRKRRDGRIETDETSRLWHLLRHRPNALHTAFEFRQLLTSQAVLRGDGCAYIQRDLDGAPIELWPLTRREVGIRRDGFELIYDVSAYDGQLSGQFTSRDMLHLRGVTMDGVRGMDRVLYARDTIGLASVAQGTQSRAFKNGNRMPGYWTTEETLSPEGADRLEAQLRKATTAQNQFRSPVLDMGITYNALGEGFRESQMVETRRHEMIEICAAFNVQPAVLGIDDKTQAFASVEAMFRAHLIHTLRPWLSAWEATIDRDLLDGGGPMFATFDTSDMEKATTKDRAESYRDLGETLVMLPNEMRRLEGLPEIAGLDEAWLEIRKGMAGIGESNADETSQPA